MNLLADPFKQLVERRLWPVALLLVAGLVAVPMLLKKEPAPAPAGPVSLSAVPAGQGATEPVVSLSDPAAREEVRAVLGDRKDPFRPAQVRAVPKPEDPLAGTTATAQASVDSGASGAGDVSSSGGSSTGGGSSAPAPSSDPVDPAPPVAPDPTAQPTPEPTPRPTYEVYSLTVRFGDVETGELETRNVKRLTGLPGGNPAALYLGPTDDGESAVFLVDASVEVVGDGDCKPAAENCETLEMEPGETVFLERGGKQWELDLIRINTRKTTDAAEARKARAAVAPGGRAALRRMGGRVPYRYDAGSGVLLKTKAGGRGLKAASFSAAG